MAFLLLAASPAAAQVAPGAPPWSCHVAAACDPGGCVEMPMLPMPLRVDATSSRHVLMLDGSPTGFYATTTEAEAAVAKGALPADAALVLVPDPQQPMDAVGLSAFARTWRSGVPGLSDTYASLICSGA